MSFSASVKRELCKAPLSHVCCARAEAYGVLLFCNAWSARKVKIITESLPFATRLPALFRKAFGVEFDRVEQTGKHILSLTDPAKLSLICDVFGADFDQTVALHINFGVLEEDCCRTAFCRGAFLAAGSVTDPEKGYHLELATSHFNVSRALPVLLREAGFAPKEATRKSNYITYFKQSEAIEDFLTSIGAPLSAMKIMNATVEKHLRNRVNRRVNCDAANLDKTVAAAQEQVDAIRKLAHTGALAPLPDKLRQTADLRVEHPELTLAQLAELCDPPVSKSCLNHRLRKLMELARGIE